MPIISTKAQNVSLDGMYGTTRCASAPASHELALFTGDPSQGGIELSGNGYARATVLPADWDALAADGSKSATVTFAAPTGEWQTVTYFALYDPTDVSGDPWEVVAVSEELEVTGAGAGPEITFTAFY